MNIEKLPDNLSEVYQGGGGDATKLLVHAIWFDASSWSKVIPILQDARHKVIAIELPLHSLAEFHCRKLAWTGSIYRECHICNIFSTSLLVFDSPV
ncbi:MAG: hypothetical protein WAK17_00730 [Candidatus Nitrosopolaris sp.]|jgi:hypothetical protein